MKSDDITRREFLEQSALTAATLPRCLRLFPTPQKLRHSPA